MTDSRTLVLRTLASTLACFRFVLSYGSFVGVAICAVIASAQLPMTVGSGANYRVNENELRSSPEKQAPLIWGELGRTQPRIPSSAEELFSRPRAGGLANRFSSSSSNNPASDSSAAKASTIEPARVSTIVPSLDRLTTSSQNLGLSSQLLSGSTAEPAEAHFSSKIPDSYFRHIAGQSNRRYGWAALARAYHNNDQRLEFTGQERTFGVEGIVAGGVRDHYDGYEFGFLGELFLNQPFNGNRLNDYPLRQSFLGNFEVDTVEISQFVFDVQFYSWTLKLGKVLTPFGRFYYPLYTNSLQDAPFIRTESILTRETGAVLEWRPGIWDFTVAVTNGSADRDTNSSKAIISRIGIDTGRFVVGGSVKWQDGIGSESQKTYNNHVGVDAMWRWGRFSLSGEAIYDQYGFRRPGFDPLDITWGRSIYNRDLNKGLKEPITGWGYYLNLNYDHPSWLLNVNYGEFSPEFIGDVIHDRMTRRLITKVVKHLGSRFDIYTEALWENDVAEGQGGRTRKGFQLLVGCQMIF